MCLARLEDFNVRLNKKGIGNGWKIFDIKDGELRGQFTTDKVRPRGKWLNEKSYRYSLSINPIFNRGSIELMNGDYPCGWHVFPAKSDARKWALGKELTRVKFKDVVATGRQPCFDSAGGLRVVVAKEIFIPNE